jgi:hypothetical protein
MLNKKALSATAGAPKVFVEDVFSCFLYTGTGSTQTITNNIDLSGKGGLVWLKNRSVSSSHRLVDTVRGALSSLFAESTSAASTRTSPSTDVDSFSSTGFVAGNFGSTNGNNWCSWTFRKAEKFFDVVTFTQSGTSGYQTINHNLGSVPGVIIIKGVGQADGWFVYHRSIPTQVTYLNQTNAAANFTLSNSVTSTTFNFNLTDFGFGNGATYVAYLFAHDAGGFGDSGSDSIIKCGSFTTDGSGNATVTLDWEPQWILMKDTQSSTSFDNWYVIDNMRGFLANGNATELYANKSNAENANVQRAAPTATGFIPQGLNASKTYIYIAIRRGPMKTPTTGTSVFTPSTRAGTGASVTTSNLSFPPDAVWSKGRDNGGTNSGAFDRLRGATQQLSLNQTDAETTASTSLTGFDVMTGYTAGADAVQLTINATGYNYVNWQFRRAPGFFDVVCYTGTGSARTVSHNLGVAPELVILKRRNSAEDWPVLQANIPTQATLNGTFSGDPPNSSYFGNGTSYVAPTSTVFSVGTNSAVNASGGTYVAYLFASLSGVSKIGSYTGNGSSVTVTTNFQPRFILVKRTDSTGNWIVGDSARGLPTGNDPALFLNSTAAETTGQDWVDVSSTGFTVNETALNANVNTGTYIYLAIA